MLIRGTCARSALYTTIVNAIATSGLWTNVSSNTTEDYSTVNAYWAGSDGQIFKSNFAKNGQYVYFAMKQIQNWGSVATDWMNIRINMMGNYTPGSPGINGTWSNYYSSYFGWSLANLGTSLTQNLEYVITIEAHRIIIAVHMAGDVTKSSNVLYVGYVDQNTAVDGSTYHNAYLIPSVCSAVPGSTSSTLGIIMLKTPSAWVQNISTSYLSPTMLSYINNPNYNGVYTVATIDVKYTLAASYLGFIGSFDGLYAIPAGNIVHLDTLTINSTNHLVIKSNYPVTVNSFGTIWMAIKLT